MEIFGLVISLLGTINMLIYLAAVRTNIFGKKKDIIIDVTLAVLGILLLLCFIGPLFF